MTISGASAKYRSTSGIAVLCRPLVMASTPVTAARASPVPNTSHASRDESTRVSTNPAAVAAMTSNTSAIKRKRTAILLEQEQLCSLPQRFGQLNLRDQRATAALGLTITPHNLRDTASVARHTSPGLGRCGCALTWPGVGCDD